MSAYQYTARVTEVMEFPVADTLLGVSSHESLPGVDQASMTLSVVAAVIGIALLVHRIRSR